MANVKKGRWRQIRSPRHRRSFSTGSATGSRRRGGGAVSMGRSAGVAAGRVRRRMASRILLAAVAAGSSFIVPLVATTPAAAEDLVPVVTGVPNVIGVAVDSNGDIFTSTDTGQVAVYPAASGTIFGTPVTQGTLTTLATLGNVAGLAFDSAGNLYMSDYNNGTVSVLSSTGGTIFGQTVATDTVTILVSGLDQPAGLAFDPAGNLYIDSESGLSVLPASSGTIFDTPVTADVLTGLTGALGTAPSKSQFVAFDSAGNLYLTDHDAGTVTVLPQASGTVFGQAVSADTYQTLVTGLSSPQGLAFDSAGDLFIATDENVSVLPAVSGTLFGSSVTADVVSPLQMSMNLYTIAFDPSGDLLLASPYDGAVLMATTQTASVSEVQFGGSVFNPEVEITGSGFGSAPPTSSPNCANTGRNYDYGNLSFQDDTAADQWQAGFDLDCVGLIVSSWTDTAIDFTFGNYYLDHEVSAGDVLADGDQYSLVVAGDFVSGTVSYRPSVTALGPTTGPSTAGTSVTITGTNFIGATGVDFGADPATSFVVDSSTRDHRRRPVRLRRYRHGDRDGAGRDLPPHAGRPVHLYPGCADHLLVHLARTLGGDRCSGHPLRSTRGAGQHRRRRDLPDRPGRAGHRAGQRRQRGDRHGQDPIHDRLPVGHRRWEDRVGRCERGGQPEHGVGIGDQSAPDRRRPRVQHPLYVRHHLQPGVLEDRPGHRPGRLRAREHRHRHQLGDVTRHLHPPDQLHCARQRGRHRLHDSGPGDHKSELPGAADHASAPEPGERGHERWVGDHRLQHLEGDGHQGHGHGPRE